MTRIVPSERRAMVTTHEAKDSPIKSPPSSKSIPRSKKASKIMKSKQRKVGATRKHRFRPGTVALREIRHYQQGSQLLIPRLPFSRIVREILQSTDKNFRLQSLALMALQEATESYMTTVISMANLCSIHARRVTIYPRDMRLMSCIRGKL